MHFSTGVYSNFANGAVTGAFTALTYAALSSPQARQKIWGGIKSVGNFVKGVVTTQATDVMATLEGTVYGQFFSKTGVLASAYETVKGMATFDFKATMTGFAHIKDSLVLRYGRMAGPRWGITATGSGISRTTIKGPYNSAPDLAAFGHDSSYANAYGSPNEAMLQNQADFQFIRDMWSGPQPGVFGQAYRLLATPVFAVKGSL